MTEPLRVAALERLGPMGHELAREALEHGSIEVHPNVLSWEGLLGEVHGHQVILLLDAELHARVAVVPAAVDGLTSAVAAAIAAESGNALAELAIRVKRPVGAHRSPYRGPT